MRAVQRERLLQTGVGPENPSQPSTGRLVHV
jgi:hypothetical protein